MNDKINKRIDMTSESAENDLTELKEQLGFSNHKNI